MDMLQLELFFLCSYFKQLMTMKLPFNNMPDNNIKAKKSIIINNRISKSNNVFIV